MTLLDEWRAVCLQNESGPDNWCRLSNAGMAGCGLSFGVNQFDLHTNPAAPVVLARVLRAARAAHAGLAITEASIVEIEAGALGLPAAGVAADAVAAGLIGPVNQALATDTGKTELMAESDIALAGDVAYLEHWIGGLSDAAGASTFLAESPPGDLLCLDFFNLFGKPTKVTTFLEGGNVTLNGGTPVPAVSSPVSLSDLLRYMLSTQQGAGPARDQRAEVLRRLNNVLAVARPAWGWSAWPAKDATWFTTALATVLASDNPHIAQSRSDGLYAVLEELAG